MPGVEDWINGPISIIHRLFEGKHEGHYEAVKDFYSKRLEDKNAASWIPSLNTTPLHNLRTNTMVRYRCMVQDMFDPEYYLGVYEVADTKTGQSSVQTGMFKDLAECSPNQEIRQESSRNVTLERHSLYCVPVPAENEWVKKAYAESCPSPSTASTSSSSRCKRPLEEEEGEKMETSEPAKLNGNASAEEIAAAAAMTSGGGGEEEKKKTKTNEESTNQPQNSPPSLNFPLPNEKGPACLVRIYDSSETYKVNDTVEFYGVLSTDPAMATFKDPKEQSAFMGADAMEAEEESAHCPPPSLVPRLHVILAHRLEHSNPLLPPDVMHDTHKTDVENILKEADVIRSELIGLFEEMLFGDKLAAEYMLCHLVSSVYARQDVVALGKFSMNLSGLPRDRNYTSNFYAILEQIVAKSWLLPMNLNNMNTLRFVPCKDYSANRLVSGVLQLSDRTHLVLDETAMEAGQLDTIGVKNITSLGNLVCWQKLEYDFNFHKQTFPTNIVTLVMSEGKSLLKCDCRVHLQPQTSTQDLDSHFKAITDKLASGVLSKMRMFLGLIQLLPYELPADLQKEIENDFVDSRKEDSKKMTVDDFHTLLVLARLLSLTHGRSTLDQDIWQRAKRLESRRKTRIPVANTETQ